MKKIAVGVLAHVDAGKTTLCESILYLAGNIRKLGRVDHGNTFLDTHQLERARGITIFSKQAQVVLNDLEIALLDTPGHADFSAEMERVLQILDYAILVISGTDGVQAHTRTLWNLLGKYKIPVFLFITKMDIAQKDNEKLVNELRQYLDRNCIDFSLPEKVGSQTEEIALCDEVLLERYLDTGIVMNEDIAYLIKQRKLFPCYFGSGLKLDGVENFLQGIGSYTVSAKITETFGAKIYKIARDDQGNRLTYLKITGGVLKVRAPVLYMDSESGQEIIEKISQIRIYSGSKYITVDSVAVGSICAVLGLTKSLPGQSLGNSDPSIAPMIEPALSYRINFPPEVELQTLLPKMLQLAEEDPQLHITWNGVTRELHAQLMGEMQIDILKSLILERFGVCIEMDEGCIMYRETIANTVEGVGHYEPLKHYAEVHLLLEPLPVGSGLVFETACSEDELGINWQQLVLTHLKERQHLGVLTGSPVTDIKITLVAGRAHLKHTEGGDFRQATYRAVRQGLMQAKSVLLEPFYQFQLELPEKQVGRAMTDIQNMSGTFEAPQRQGEIMLLTGIAPVAKMRPYAKEFMSYTHGQGKLTYHMHGYAPCHNAEEVIAAYQYDPQGDLEHSPNSVFCFHGAGSTVKWDQVEKHMHVESWLKKQKRETEPVQYVKRTKIDEKELEAIMLREFGPIKRSVYQKKNVELDSNPVERISEKEEFLIVDGYNVIFAWDDLKKIANENMDLARHRLMDTLSNYRGWRKCELVLVFDAYKVEGASEKNFDYHGIQVVFTRQGETGDVYIEKRISEIGKNYAVHIVTSDALIQLSAVRKGVLRMSAREFKMQVDQANEQIQATLRKMEAKGSNGAKHTMGELRQIYEKEVRGI